MVHGQVAWLHGRVQRVCHHGSKDQALGKVRDLAPLV